MPSQTLDEYLSSTPPVIIEKRKPGHRENPNESYPHLNSWTEWTDFTYNNMRKHLGRYLGITVDFTPKQLREEDRSVEIEKHLDRLFIQWHMEIVNNAMAAIYDEDCRLATADSSASSVLHRMYLTGGSIFRRNGDLFNPDWAAAAESPGQAKNPSRVPGDSKFTDVLFHKSDKRVPIPDNEDDELSHESDERVPVPDDEDDDSNSGQKRTPEEAKLDYKYGCLEQVCAYAKSLKTRYAYLITNHQAIFVRIKRNALGPRSPIATRSWRPGMEIPDIGSEVSSPVREHSVTPRSTAVARSPQIPVIALNGTPQGGARADLSNYGGLTSLEANLGTTLTTIHPTTPKKPYAYPPKMIPGSPSPTLSPPATNTPSVPWLVQNNKLLNPPTSPSPASRRPPTSNPTVRKSVTRSANVRFQAQYIPSSPPVGPSTPRQARQPSPSASTATNEPPLPSLSYASPVRGPGERFWNSLASLSSQPHHSDGAYTNGSYDDFDLETAEIAIVPWNGREDGLTVLHGFALLLRLAAIEHDVRIDYSQLGSDDAPNDPDDEA